MKLKVLYEDNHLLVVEKPANMPSQADSSGDEDLLSVAKEYIRVKYNKPGAAYLGLVHRLDRPVGGVMVFARTSKAAARLTEQFAAKRYTTKLYMALVQPHKQENADINIPPSKNLEGYILKDEKTGSARICTALTPGAKRATLRYNRCTQNGGLTLLNVELGTGRHHQIRIQLANEGLAIWGDQRYNAAARPGEQIALWAYSLSIQHPTEKKRMEFVSIPTGGAWSAFDTEIKLLAAGIQPLYADENLLAVNKPRGVAVAAADDVFVQEDSTAIGKHQQCMELQLNAVLDEEVIPIHRLDVATEGVLLFARNKNAANELDLAMKNRSFRKVYECLVKGVMSEKTAVCHAWLKKDAEHALVRVASARFNGAVEIITKYSVMSVEDDCSRLEIDLITGRTHQIRAHMSHLHHPLLGDDKYGDFAFNRMKKADYLHLCAKKMVIQFPLEAKLSYLNGLSLEVSPKF